MKSMLNHNVLDGEPKLQALRRSSIKLATSPQIAVAIPIGDKHEHTMMVCPKSMDGCGMSWAASGVRIPNMVPAQWSMSQQNMVVPLNVSMQYLFEGGRLSAEARQIMTKKAIRMGVKYILYWDDDTLPPEMGLYTLHNWMEQNPEAGAISGVYTSRVDPPEPFIYEKHGAGAWWDFPMGPGAEPQPIFGAGAGFLMARIEAISDTIAKMTEANSGQEIPIWADERTILSTASDGERRRVLWGHDVRFCRLLNKHDWPVYVHGAVLCGHLDIATQKIYTVPNDAPGLKMQRQKNINTADYWDEIYGEEGPNTWRQYPAMFDKVVDHMPDNVRVLELGCGVGILGSRLTAQRQITYKGYDISPQAVKIAQARFLNAEVADITKLVEDTFVGYDILVATEVFEHLSVDNLVYLLQCARVAPNLNTIIFTIPDGNMPPEKVSEHLQDFNEEYARNLMGFLTDNGWELHIEPAGDDVHLFGILQRTTRKA